MSPYRKCSSNSTRPPPPPPGVRMKSVNTSQRQGLRSVSYCFLPPVLPAWPLSLQVPALELPGKWAHGPLASPGLSLSQLLLSCFQPTLCPTNQRWTFGFCTEFWSQSTSPSPNSALSSIPLSLSHQPI